MASTRKDEVAALFDEQVGRLQEIHYQILYWSAIGEDRHAKYNITNLFDDLKSAGLTRTKQTAVAAVAALSTLCFIDLRDEHNRKNIYITHFGARALEMMVTHSRFQPRKSVFLQADNK